jgi:hypothetical protein
VRRHSSAARLADRDSIVLDEPQRKGGAGRDRLFQQLAVLDANILVVHDDNAVVSYFEDGGMDRLAKTSAQAVWPG